MNIAKWILCWFLTLLAFEMVKAKNEDSSEKDVAYYEQKHLDPGRYYAQLQAKKSKKRKKTNRRKGQNNGFDLAGSESSSKKSSGSNKLRYTFLQAEDPPTSGSSGTKCHTPSGGLGAFQFLNFAMAAGTLAGNLISNANSNNRNNNNNNNNNNFNSNNFNINSNNNNAGNTNTIMIPVGKKKKRSLRTRGGRKTSHLRQALKNIKEFISMDGHESHLEEISAHLLKHVHMPTECTISTRQTSNI